MISALIISLTVLLYIAAAVWAHESDIKRLAGRQKETEDGKTD